MYRILITLPALKRGDTAAATPGEPVRDLVVDRGAAYFIGTLSQRASSAALLVELPLEAAEVTAHLNASVKGAFPGFSSELPEEVSFLEQFQDPDYPAPSVLRCAPARDDVTGEADMLSVTYRPVPGWLAAQIPELTRAAMKAIRGE